LSFSKKTQKSHTLIPKNDVTEPKVGCSNNQLNCYQVKSQFQTFKNHGFWKPETIFYLLPAF